MSLGRYSYGSPIIHSWVGNNKLEVGKFCSLAKNLHVYLDHGKGHDISFVSTYPFGIIFEDTFTNINNNSRNSNGDVTIGNDVWIGENVTIMSGVTIGDGAVISNNSHVVKNVEPYSLVGGNPANFIKYRFTREQIDKLLEIKWWDWEDEKINRFASMICSNNIDEFIKAASSQ